MELGLLLHRVLGKRTRRRVDAHRKPQKAGHGEGRRRWCGEKVETTARSDSTCHGPMQLNSNRLAVVRGVLRRDFL
jgi:hypothetical protein